MIVVADANPLHYLILIEAVDSLRSLYGRVLIPQTVANELSHESTPAAVHNWMAMPPEWLEVHAEVDVEPFLANLDAGESAAIALSLFVMADLVLMDDWDGRVEAARRRLRVTGCLGVLAEAHRNRLLGFDAAIRRLQRTNFYLSPALIRRVRERLGRS